MTDRQTDRQTDGHPNSIGPQLWGWGLKRRRSKEIYFSQRLSYNVFLTTSLKQRLSHNVFITTPFSQRLFHTVALAYSSTQRSPHNVTHYRRNLSVLYKSPNISQIRLSSVPCNFDILRSIKVKPQYIFFHCVKFQNPRTEISYQSAADKVLYKYAKICLCP